MAENKFKLEFILKQHTPIIHFQHDQAGATLRASELKPRLDKYIIGHKVKVFGNEQIRLEAALNDPALSLWLKRKKEATHPAFDYQVKINPLRESTDLRSPRPIEDRYPGFFANMGENKGKYCFVYHDLILLEINSTNNELLSYIETILSGFLLSTNFGTRQSKGFGSFYLLDTPDSMAKDLSLFSYAFDMDVSEERSEERKIKQVFHIINLLYNSLRSGINHNFYFKSMLWWYLRKKEIQWDKKTIKQQFLKRKEMDQKRDYREQDENNKPVIPDTPLFYEKGKEVMVGGKSTHLLWRDLLGLSTNQEWRSEYASLTKESEDREGNVPKYARMKSPILFKPLRTGKDSFRVYFGVPKSIKEDFLNGPITGRASEVLNKWFKIEMTRNNSPLESPLSIPFPMTFDFDDFFKTAFSTNLDNYVRQKKGKRNFVDYPDYILLRTLYTNLKLQIKNTNEQG